LQGETKILAICKVQKYETATELEDAVQRDGGTDELEHSWPESAFQFFEGDEPRQKEKQMIGEDTLICDAC